MSRRSVPVIPSDGCRDECRALVQLDGERTLGFESEDGAPLCSCCRRALARAFDGTHTERLPLRPKNAQRHELQRTSCSWREAVETAARGMAAAIEGRSTLLCLSLASRPQRGDLLLQRLTGLVPRACMVRRVDGRDWVAAHCRSEWPDRPASIEQIDLWVLWGAAPERIFRPILPQLQRTARVVVDPTATRWVEGAIHLGLRPGSDGPLAEAWALAGGSERGEGDQRRQAESCGVELGAFAEALSAWNSATHPALVIGGGVGRHRDSRRAISTLQRLASRRGASLMAPPALPEPWCEQPLPEPQRLEMIPSGRFRQRLESLDPRGLTILIEGGDPRSLGVPDKALFRWLREARFVMAFTDLPPTLPHDLWLPKPLPGEQADLVPLRGPLEWRRGEAAIAPRAERHSAARFWRLVGRELSWGENWFDGSEPSIDDVAATMPEPRAGTPLPDEPEHSGADRTEEGPVTTPDLYRAFRLSLALGRPRRCCVGPFPGVTLNPEEARARGIETGAQVVVHNERGSLGPMPVQLDPFQPRGTALVEGGVDRVAVLLPGPSAESLEPAADHHPPTLVEVNLPE